MQAAAVQFNRNLIGYWYSPYHYSGVTICQSPWTCLAGLMLWGVLTRLTW